MLLEEYILNQKEDFNGHFQMTISLNYVDALSLLKDIEDYNDTLENKHLNGFFIELFSDGSWFIVQRDFFIDHPLGHKDRILVGKADV